MTPWNVVYLCKEDSLAGDGRPQVGPGHDDVCHGFPDGHAVAVQGVRRALDDFQRVQVVVALSLDLALDAVGLVVQVGVEHARGARQGLELVGEGAAAGARRGGGEQAAEHKEGAGRHLFSLGKKKYDSYITYMLRQLEKTGHANDD